MRTLEVTNYNMRNVEQDVLSIDTGNRNAADASKRVHIVGNLLGTIATMSKTSSHTIKLRKTFIRKAKRLLAEANELLTGTSVTLTAQIS